jgi:hypothetical protein
LEGPKTTALAESEAKPLTSMPCFYLREKLGRDSRPGPRPRLGSAARRAQILEDPLGVHPDLVGHHLWLVVALQEGAILLQQALFDSLVALVASL